MARLASDSTVRFFSPDYYEFKSKTDCAAAKLCSALSGLNWYFEVEFCFGLDFKR